jgi:hypothetical protein
MLFPAPSWSEFLIEVGICCNILSDESSWEITIRDWLLLSVPLFLKEATSLAIDMDSLLELVTTESSPTA